MEHAAAMINSWSDVLEAVLVVAVVVVVALPLAELSHHYGLLLPSTDGCCFCCCHGNRENALEHAMHAHMHVPMRFQLFTM